jgi:hypothetical protein
MKQATLLPRSLAYDADCAQKIIELDQLCTPDQDFNLQPYRGIRTLDVFNRFNILQRHRV